MARIEGEIVINRRVEDVFDFVADERNEPRYNSQMLSAEQVSSGPIGLGTRFKAELKSGARTLPLLIEFTAFDRPRLLHSHASFSGMVTDGELTFEPLGDSTRMRWAWELKPSGPLKLIEPLLAWQGRRQERAVWSGLKRCLET